MLHAIYFLTHDRMTKGTHCFGGADVVLPNGVVTPIAVGARAAIEYDCDIQGDPKPLKGFLVGVSAGLTPGYEFAGVMLQVTHLKKY
jgi:hypothetical protein